MSRPAGMARRRGRELTGCGARVAGAARRDSDVGPLCDGRSNQARASGSHMRVIPTANRVRRSASVGGSDPLAADGQGWRPARSTGRGHGVLPPAVDIDRIHADEPGKCRSATPFQVG